MEKIKLRENMRKVDETSQGFWSSYKEDVERILHSKAYRRYTDKTQVVYLVQNDHVTHRSLHVQLVSSYARSIAQKLNLDVDLVEAIALGHDVGHPPFGHEGEQYLSEVSVSESLGYFSHSRQSCRLYSEIEPLNLTFQVLDGFLCHDGGMKRRNVVSDPNKSWEQHSEEMTRRTLDHDCDFRPKTLEGCLVKMCDTVSYLGKDIEDALSLGLIDPSEIPKTMLGTTGRKILENVAKDLCSESPGKNQIVLSEEVFESLKIIRAFNFNKIYQAPCLKTESHKIRASFKLLFQALKDDYEKKGIQSLLWKNFLHSRTEKYRDETNLSQKLIDYIAGMTDSYFVRLFKKLLVPQTIEIPDDSFAFRNSY